MDHDPEKVRLFARYRALKEKKEAALSSHHCSKCGMRWSVGGSYFCLDCGTAYGSCCVHELARTVHAVTLDIDGDAAILRYRCGCSGRVG